MGSEKIFSRKFAIRNHQYAEMKKVRIHISKLGPIVDQDVELAPLMLFTGDSNLGKSYTNFLCYYLFNLAVSDRLNEFLLAKLKTFDATAQDMEFTLRKDDIRLWMEEDVVRFFRYLLAYPEMDCNVHFYFDDAPDLLHIKIILNEDVDNDAIPVHLDLNGRAFDFRISKSYKYDDILRWVKYLLIEALVGKLLINSYLMPPGRASLLSGSFTTQKGSSKMGLYEIFLGDNDRINFRVLRSNSFKEDQQFFQSRIKKLIGGDLAYGVNGLELKLNNGKIIPIEAAASSIKELAPILMWMQGSSNMNYDSLCIEEPEAHCHPMMQSQLADMLVACINKGTIMQISTHSDYLLKRLNELLRLSYYKDVTPEKFEKFCDEFQHSRNLVLTKDTIKAYYFHYSDADQSVKIDLQDLSDGIPFDSFSQILDEEFEFDNYWEDENENS